ncbi:MAG TPA: IPTL-CTERM sorting domain-containing protein [Thermoanaerobaculia bacterium]|nr:IPTL-CTERM sorting domain-containing protein [Thermoanaerobaculia bacterium]
MASPTLGSWGLPALVALLGLFALRRPRPARN